MPRCFFHFHDVPPLKEARSEAVVFMGERLTDLDGEFWPEGGGVSGPLMKPARRSAVSQ
jgi:hypothetical protein